MALHYHFSPSDIYEFDAEEHSYWFDMLRRIKEAEAKSGS